MEIAGIDKDTPDPVGGIIVRDPETGEPTGVFLETAQKLVETALPKAVSYTHLTLPTNREV